MKNDTSETYQTPALCELGKAEDLTKGLDEGYAFDFHAGYRIQKWIVPVDGE